MPAFVAVGIDCSDTTHEVYAEADPPDPATPPLRLRLPNELSGFHQLLDRLREAFGDRPCRFALENPSLLLARFLLHVGAAVYPVNPRAVVRMREALAASGKKDDPLDAEVLCLLLRQQAEECVPLRLGSEAAQRLAGLEAQRLEVVEEKTRVLNQLTALLKRYYPRSLELFGKLDQPMTRSFLRAFPSPQALADATEAQWQEFFTGQRYPRPERIRELWTQARAPQVPVSPIDTELGVGQLLRLLRRWEVLLEEQDALTEALSTHFERLPEAKLFQSLPGAGPVLAPALCALFGDDRKRWQDWRQLAGHSGTAPITRSSGRQRSVHMRWHCDRQARRTLHLFAGCSRQSCAWAREFYTTQRRRGKSHGTALRNLATRWLRIIYRMWKDEAVYDEQKYLQRRAKRQAPLPSRAEVAART